MTRIGIGALTLALLAACARESEPAQPQAEAVQPQTATVAAPPVDMTKKEVETTVPVGGPELVTSVRVGSSERGEATSIPAGAPIITTLDTKPLPAGSVVRMVLRRGDEAVETQKGAEENARSVVITNDQTGDLEPGDWTLEIWLGGEKVDQRTITISSRK